MLKNIDGARAPSKKPRPKSRRSPQDIAATAAPVPNSLHVVAARIAARTGLPFIVVREHAAAAGLGGR